MKSISMVTIVFTIILFLSCNSKPVYTEFKVIPVETVIQTAEGSDSFIAVKIEIPQKHYIYGNPKGPGIGKPTTLKAFSSVFEFKETRYLPAEQYRPEPNDDFVWRYTGETYVFIPFISKQNTPWGEYKVSLRFESLMCDNASCIPKDTDISVTVIIAEVSKVQYGQNIITLFQSSKPPIRKIEKSKNDNLNKFDNAEITKTQKKEIFPAGGSQDISRLKNELFKPQYMKSSEVSGLLQAILFGLLAGLILNIMPCVLPVVSIKILSFVQHAGEDRKVLITLGLLFALGILVTFGILAALASFMGYSWGGLFQHRMFLVIMTAIIFALALSMFHVFTLNSPALAGKAAAQKHNIYADAFFKGLLATLLATPCSGPFLGGTLAWALTQKPVIIFTIFMSVGIGMALPYFVLTINPKLVKRIPKPGPWMDTFEKVMGFFLIFTVVYMLNILDSGSLMPAVTFLAFLALGLWQFGRFGSIVETGIKRIFSAGVLALIIVSGYFISFNYLYVSENKTKLQGAIFDIARVYSNKDAGRITIIKFTADWCPNCKVVEKMSLYTDAVFEAIKKYNVDFITADITIKQPAAEKLLELLGSKSIPFLAILPPGEKFYTPVCLRDMYSEKDVLQAIEKAAQK